MSWQNCSQIIPPREGEGDGGGHGTGTDAKGPTLKVPAMHCPPFAQKRVSTTEGDLSFVDMVSITDASPLDTEETCRLAR